MHLAFTKKIYYIIRACLIYKRKHIRLLIKSHDHVIIIQVIYVLVHQSVLFIQICQLPLTSASTNIHIIIRNYL